MTVHYSGKLTLTADDFKTTHRGVEIGVKCIAWDGSLPVISLVERMGSEYQSTYLLFEFSDSPNTPEELVAAAGGTDAWLVDVLMPRINEALSQRFPVDEAPQDKPGSIEDIDARLGVALRWAPMADGTLQVAPP